MRVKYITVSVSVRVSVTVRVSLVWFVRSNSFGASSVAICRPYIANGSQSSRQKNFAGGDSNTDRPVVCAWLVRAGAWERHAATISGQLSPERRKSGPTEWRRGTLAILTLKTAVTALIRYVGEIV